MSSNWEGALFQTTEQEAAEFFVNLVPATELRLILVDGDSLFGIYSEWKNRKKTLSKIARQASQIFELALCYGEYSAVGYACELFEHGKQTRNLNSQEDWKDNWGDGHLFEVFGYALDDESRLGMVIESAFNWGNDQWLLEHTPSYDRYR